MQALVTIRERLIDTLKQQTATWMVSPVLVAMFGSAARGDGGLDSDIDLLLVRRKSIADALAPGSDSAARQWAAQVAALRDQVHATTGNPAHILEMPAGTFAPTLRSPSRSWPSGAGT